MNKREILKRIIENWFVEKTSIKPTKDGLNSLVDRIHYNKQLTLTDVVSSASKCYTCGNCFRVRNDAGCIVCGSE